jgi:hypothetical protein
MSEVRKQSHGQIATFRDPLEREAFVDFVRATMTFGCHHCDATTRWDNLKVPLPDLEDGDAVFHFYCSDACADAGCVPEFCKDRP